MKECGDCANKEWNWYKLIGIVLATRPADAQQQTLGIVQEQYAMQHSLYFDLEQLAGLLKGKAYNVVIDSLVMSNIQSGLIL